MRYGRFLSAKIWDPVALNFGALPFIYGTLVTSILALILGVPLGIGASIFLAELAPPRTSDGLAFLIELLAAVPSVIYGLLAIFTLVPFIRDYASPVLKAVFGFLPLFGRLDGNFGTIFANSLFEWDRTCHAAEQAPLNFGSVRNDAGNPPPR